MQNLIPTGNTLTMTSLELVDFINAYRKKQADIAGADFPSKDFAKVEHGDFLKKVSKVLKVKDLVAGNFSSYYIAANGKANPMYVFPKRESCLMAMSYSYELQAAVFDHMTALEERLAKPAQTFAIPQSLSEALRLAADQAERIEQQAAQLAIAAPKVEFVDRYVENTGTMTFRQVAKLLKANERVLRQLLINGHVMYRLNVVMTPYQNHIDAGRFEVKTGISDRNNHAFAQARFTPKGVQWIAGLWASRSMQEAA
jgi:phage antirepressor YoqD-like protein